MKFLATLILNWNEDGKIYKERLQEKEDAPPPLNLNPWIRGFRLAFVLLFVAFDVGMIIYNKVSYDTTCALLTHNISVIHTSFLTSKWNLYPKIINVGKKWTLQLLKYGFCNKVISER